MSDVTSDSFQSDRAFFGAVERYNTPPTTPTGYRCRRVRIPDNMDFIAAVNELLSRLCFPEMWLERVGGLTPDEAAVLANVMYDDYAESDGYCMIGTVVPVMRATLPANMLWCDGSTYLRTDYPDLYAVSDSVFIVDADHFVVPDLRHRTVIGSDTDYPVNASGGEATHTLTTAEMPSHTHTIGPHNHGITDPGHNHTQNTHSHGVTDPGHTHTQNSHNHTQDSHNHTQNSHNHTQDVHGHTLNELGHTHVVFGRANATGFGTTNRAARADGGGTDSPLAANSATSGATIANATATNQATTPTNNAATATNQAATATNISNTTGITTQNTTPTNNSATTGITTNLAGLGPDNTGGGGAHNNLPPYRVLPFAVIAK